jgi:HSP20 family protein
MLSKSFETAATVSGGALMNLNLIPWKRRAEGVFPLRRQIDRLFEDFLGGEPFDLQLGNGGLDVSLDVAETPEAVIVKAEVPGIDPKEIEISVNQNTLTLRGERKEEKEEKGKTWHRVERSYGAFARSVLLPAAVEGDRAEAETKNGVLTVTLPKTKAAIPKKIEVKTK